MAKDEIKVVVIVMTRNEEANILRCLNTTIDFCDAICVSDTGSKDDTVSIVKKWAKTEHKIPTHVAEYEFTNFGDSRTRSLKEAKKFCKKLGWDMKKSYALLLDADYAVNLKPEFNKNDLIDEGYTVMQGTNRVYPNIRFIRLDINWKCFGVVHECWGGGKKSHLDTLHIHDYDAGGDGTFLQKQERYKHMLIQGLKDEPNNTRYMFYLARTYECLSDYDNAIIYFIKRISSGGYADETWFSMWRLSIMYEKKKNYTNMEYWGLKAYEFSNTRSENLHTLAKKFRELGQYYKAWHYLLMAEKIPMPKSRLFLSQNVYIKDIKFERNVLAYYVGKCALKSSIEYFNNWNCNLTFNNMRFYIKNKSQVHAKLDFIKNSSNIGILSLGDDFLLYVEHINGGLSTILVDDKFQAKTELTEVKIPKISETKFLLNGDKILIFGKNGEEFISGVYDKELSEVSDIKSQPLEKFNKSSNVVSLYPFTMIDKNGKLITIKTPNFFNKMHFININGSYVLCRMPIVNTTAYVVIKITNDTLQYSLPFYLTGKNTKTLGMHIENNEITIPISLNVKATSAFITRVNIADLEFLNI